MKKYRPWWRGTLGPNRVRVPYSITFSSRKRRLKYEMNMKLVRKTCIWRCICGRWNVTKKRFTGGNRRVSWRFICPCGTLNHIDSEKTKMVENQIEAWTIIAGFRSIEEEATIPDR